MPRIADYVLIRDKSFDLDDGLNQEKEMEFFVNSDLATGKKSEKPILAYNARPLGNSATIAIFVNGGSPIETVTISENTVRALWEAFPATKLTPGADNEVAFQVTAGQVRISDVILWHQRNI